VRETIFSPDAKLTKKLKTDKVLCLVWFRAPCSSSTTRRLIIKRKRAKCCGCWKHVNGRLLRRMKEREPAGQG
jgi:hypothetical protein